MRGDSPFSLTRSLYLLSHCLAPRRAPVIGAGAGVRRPRAARGLGREPAGNLSTGQNATQS